MPGLVRKLFIFAAVDGLILQPAPARNHSPPSISSSSTLPAVRIDYKGVVSTLQRDRKEEDAKATPLEAHGIVGLLKVASLSFLISISSREQIALVRGKPVYVITDVALIPLSDQAAAENAIVQAREHLKRHQELAGKRHRDDEGDTDSSTESDAGSFFSDSDIDDWIPSSSPRGNRLEVPGSRKSEGRPSVAEDVIGKRGLYGRFAEKWFSRRGWSNDGRRMQGMSSHENLRLGKYPVKPEADINLESGEDVARKLDEQPAAADVAVSPDTKDQSSLLSQQQQHQEPLSPEDLPKALAKPTDDSAVALLPKMLRTTKLYFASRSFFFSYDYDLSRNVANQAPATSTAPLYKQFDPLFFWNQHIISPLIEANHHHLVLPLLQGFVGQRAFTVDVVSNQNSVLSAASEPEEVISIQESSQQKEKAETTKKDYLLTVISRRSTKRAGLRYLRRGIDEEGYVANNVETEQILSSAQWDSGPEKLYSFTQCRGSIPLFFSQSPYTLKPVVTFWGSEETNAAAFKLHFAALAARYGGVQAASLVDKHATEAAIGQAYEKHAEKLNENGGIDGKGKLLGFEWFDFHSVCRGMRFENVSILMEKLQPALSSYGWTIIESSSVTKSQSGVLRTNCMDCLDRTNVVQSACARSALEQQLAEENVSIDLQTDPRTAWFNTLWADNGDAISKQYAGTAALKGDFTRTRHRNIAGALTDFGLTLSRYYNNIVNDYFAQAVIDYILGRASDAIFTEFEADMKSQDYAVDLRKVRQAAINRCADIVISSPKEDLIAGWTFSCPARSDTRRSQPFEECVLLLTDKALYFCRLDWATEKVREFERIDAARVLGLSRGAYVTSALSKRDMDTDRNVGFVIRFAPADSNEAGILKRVNTRTLGNEMLESQEQDAEEAEASQNQEELAYEGVDIVDTAKDHEQRALETPADKDKKDTPISTDKAALSVPEKQRFLAFKALPPNSTFITLSTDGTETPQGSSPGGMDLIAQVCDQIASVVNKLKDDRASVAREWSGKPIASEEEAKVNEAKVDVEEKDVVSLAEAKRSTGYLEQLGYSIKRFVWT